ncbi:odorant receptor 63a isoform X2 [Camponotus floridanus]|uniref:odorant receptor 63a isoform X2 n=1 Tax=Camponotus floridanus TaxID=104421 RepID=UPI000DC6D037|nr:odorant receptor 63a isoform X2 [Camponotus floridanus]
MSFYDNHYYYINKMLLSLIGQWPFQSRLEGNIMFVITLFFICSLTILELWGLIAGITDLSVIIENVSPLLMKDLLEHIEETWKMTQTKPERKILESYAEQTKTLTIQYAITIYAMWISYSTMPFVIKGIHLLLPSNETYPVKFLYRLEHVLDVDKYFNLLMLHGIISIFYIVSIPIAVDTMFILYVQHTCALFKNICNMKNIRSSDFEMLKPDIANDETYHIIIKYVKSYKYALRFSDLLSSTYTTCNFFLLGNVIISLSFSAAELIMVANELDEIVRIIASNMAQLIHIFYLNLISQRLIDHSSRLQEAIYNCDWYKLSLRSRHLLRFMLMRAIKPCYIRAGKMYVMSLENFSSILQVSMSYFTMLTSMQI